MYTVFNLAKCALLFDLPRPCCQVNAIAYACIDDVLPRLVLQFLSYGVDSAVQCFTCITYHDLAVKSIPSAVHVLMTFFHDLSFSFALTGSILLFNVLQAMMTA